MKKERTYILTLCLTTILLITGCIKVEHYNTKDIEKYLKEKYPNSTFTISDEYKEEIYDRDNNTKRTWTITTDTNETCLAYSVEHYQEHRSYEIRDNCDNLLN